MNELSEQYNANNLKHKLSSDILECIFKCVGKFDYSELTKNSEKIPLLYYFDQNTKLFNIINPFSDTDIKYGLNIPDNLSIFSGFCELPDDQYFFYGGHIATNNNMNHTYIIDLKTKSAVKKLDYTAKGIIGLCSYYKNAVYVFGGYIAAAYTNLSEKYIIDLNI